MFGLSTIKIALIGTAIAFVLGGVGGARVQKAFCNEKFYRAQIAAKDLAIETLQARVKAAGEAQQEDARTAEQNAALAQEEKRKSDALADMVAAGGCFTATDVGRVRELWGGHGKGPGTGSHPLR